MHYIKVYVKGLSKNDFAYVEASDVNLLYQLCSKPVIQYPTYFTLVFTFAYYLISIPLCTMFKDLAFPTLCLVPNEIDFVWSCPKCILKFLSTNQSDKLEKSLISCFSISITLLRWNTMQVSSL